MHVCSFGRSGLWPVAGEASWRRVLGQDFSPTIPVMLERFELIYPTTGPTPPVD